jgi:hypothetical protein
MQPYGPPPQRPGPPAWLLPAGIIGGAIVLLLVVLGAIGAVIGEPIEPAANRPAVSASSSTPKATPKAANPPPATSAAPATTHPAPPAAPTRRRAPYPTTEQGETYLATIADIDPGLVIKRERALSRARGVCDRMINPPGGTVSLERYTAYMLSGGDVQITEQEAEEVIKAVRVWCR